jgi:hypothetical protein
LWSGYAICETIRTSATTALVVDNISLQSIYSTETLPSPTDSNTPYDYAYPLQIRWDDSDFAKTNTILSASTSSTILSTSALPTSSSTKSPSSNHSLATGTIAAITVGVGVLVIVSLLVLAIWGRRKRVHKPQAILAMSELNAEGGEPGEPSELGTSKRVAEVSNNVS